MLAIVIYLIIYGANTASADIENEIDVDVIKTEHYVTWPNAVVPFYIEPGHFDQEQSLAIMTALSLFAFRSCLKFNPVMVRPSSTQHVLVFENPNGVRKCVFDTEGHPPEGPHKVTLGYGCMKSPQIDMVVMRALGFSFEHNRASRDLFIDIQFENIDPSAVELFTKESKLPPELRPLRYDVNSVMHFGDRDFSKNGHRTILFKDHTLKQHRIGLTELDLRKIEIVYGPECLTRERKEKYELCQNYPGVARRKREVGPMNVTNLRVNREITPPPEVLKNATAEDREVDSKNEAKQNQSSPLAQLGIENDAKEIADKMYHISSTAFNNARVKHCNDTGIHLRAGPDDDGKVSDPLGALDLLSKYARTITSHAAEDADSFCTAPNSVEKYIARCGFDNNRCKQLFKSTLSMYRWVTQHKEPYPAFTKNPNRGNLYDPISRRSNNSQPTDEKGESKVRTKRNAPPMNMTKTKENENKKKENKKIKTETKVEKAKTQPPTSSKSVPVTVNSTSVTKKKDTDGRRRFRDSPFSVYRRNKNDKEGMYASDVSMEAKQKKKSKKIKTQSKHKTHKKDKRHTRSEVEIGKSRNKREATPVTKKIEDAKKVIIKKEPIVTSSVDIKANQSTSKKQATSEAKKVGKKRRFQDNPFSVFRKKSKATDYASDVSLEVPKKDTKKEAKKETKKETKKAEKMKKKLGHTKVKKVTTDRSVRKKREVTPLPSSAKPEVKAQNKSKALSVSPVYHVNRVDHNTSMRIANETLIHGIRRFRDSPFSVYKVKKNEKKYMYASDLSLENKKVKKSRKSKKSKKKASLAKAKENGAGPRVEVPKVREKREVELDKSSIEVIEDGERNIMIEENPELVEDKNDFAENGTTVAKRRFKIIPFGADNMNYEKDVYPSDLSLESKTETIFKSSKPFPRVQPTHLKKKRAKPRQQNQGGQKDILGVTMSMEIKNVAAEKPANTRPVFKTVKLTKKNEEFYADRKWPDGVVRYMIRDIPKYDMEDVRYRLEEVNRILKEKTCVYLMEITKQDRNLFEDYLMLDTTPDYVTGRVGGKQHFGVTELFEGGQHRQHAAMVVMSMLGFYFEPSRHDRDRYIRVHPRHIRADKLHHFEILRPDATLSLPYDYKSATHPPWQFWRHFGKTGISSLATYKDQDPDGSIMKSLGHHAKLLSDMDIIKINSVYGLRCFRETEKKGRTI